MAFNLSRKGGKKNRKWGRQKKKPAFQRYWAACFGRGRRYDRKIRALIRSCGLTPAEARNVLDRTNRYRRHRSTGYLAREETSNAQA